MMNFLKKIGDNESGSVITEFAICAPALLVLLLGIFQVGFAVQAKNSMQSVIGEVGRNVAVAYLNSETEIFSEGQVELLLTNTATNAAYRLNGENIEVDAAIVDSDYTGIKKLTLQINYGVPMFMPLGSMDQIDLEASRTVYIADRSVSPTP